MLARPVYGYAELLCLKPGTAKRWIDGYSERDGSTSLWSDRSAPAHPGSRVTA
jgi:hypothetical protein